MSEHPPKKLSRGKRREVARVYALETDLHTQTKEAIAEAKEAHKRAKYVERGVGKIVLDATVDLAIGTSARQKNIKKAYYDSAPIEPTQDIPTTGRERRKAARAYSKAHDISGQIREEQRRLKNLEQQTKRLETGPITRAVFGTRSRKYEEALFREAKTKEVIQAELAKTAEEKLKFRAPKPKKIIDITPPAYVEEEEQPVRETSRVEVGSGSGGVILSEEEMDKMVEEAELYGFADEMMRNMGSMRDVGTVTMSEQEMEEEVGRAEFEQFQKEVQRRGKSAGKASVWRRARAWLSSLGALFLVGYGAHKTAEYAGVIPPETPGNSESEVRTPSVRTPEEAWGPYDGPPVSREEASAESATIVAPGGFEPPDAPPPREP